MSNLKCILETKQKEIDALVKQNSDYQINDQKLLAELRVKLEIKEIQLKMIELEKTEKTQQTILKLNEFLLKHVENCEYEKAQQIILLLGYLARDRILNAANSDNQSEDSITINESNESNEESQEIVPNENLDENQNVNEQENLMCNDNFPWNENEPVCQQEENRIDTIHIPTFAKIRNDDSFEKYYFITCSSDKWYHSKLKILYKSEKQSCNLSNISKFDCDLNLIHYHMIASFGCKYHLSYFTKKLKIGFVKCWYLKDPKMIKAIVKQYQLNKVN